ncbi:nicotinate phosphoribosyltransferase [bacterium]|nr:nicotinate phosphoribosyltransferase [bacterium]
MSNIILSSDSYKYSQFNQYPKNTEFVYSYIESRGGEYDKLVFFGTQMFLKEYMSKPITQDDIDEAEDVITAHGLPFNKDGWEYILNAHNGYLPVEVKALDEGSVVTPKLVLLTIVNTDAKCWWLTSFLETALLKAIWYPTTVASNSYKSKKIIKKYLDLTGDVTGLPFKLHDFGFRGVSSRESAGIGGLAHLVNFQGTDTIEALMYGRKYYDVDMAGFSIPATEHSTITSWGRSGEVDAYSHVVDLYSKPDSIYSCVSDSWDFNQACHYWGTALKDKVISSGGTLVVRPDSGIPEVVVPEGMDILESYYGHTLNSKGYKVLNNVRMIQGDGIGHDSIESILWILKEKGYSADNIAFGQGGGLLQSLDRDTCRFAMKCSAIRVSGEWRDVYKDPVGDKGKRSKKGRFSVVNSDNGYITGVYGDDGDLLTQRFYNGELINTTTFDEVRLRS